MDLRVSNKNNKNLENKYVSKSAHIQEEGMEGVQKFWH